MPILRSYQVCCVTSIVCFYFALETSYVDLNRRNQLIIGLPSTASIMPLFQNNYCFGTYVLMHSHDLIDGTYLK